MISHSERQKRFRDQRAEWKRSGITHVRIIASPDVALCDDCVPFAGKTYPLRRAPEMPLHQGCHCELMPLKSRE